MCLKGRGVDSPAHAGWKNSPHVYVSLNSAARASKYLNNVFLHACISNLVLDVRDRVITPKKWLKRLWLENESVTPNEQQRKHFTV
jgi:hypothetical protein